MRYGFEASASCRSDIATPANSMARKHERCQVTPVKLPFFSVSCGKAFLTLESWGHCHQFRRGQSDGDAFYI